MSTEKTNKYSFLQDSDKVSVIATLATVILLAIAVFAGYYWGAKDAQRVEPKSNAASSSTTILATSAIPIPPSPPTIFAYSGEITSIEEGTIYIRASLQENGAAVEKNLKVSTSEGTQYSKLDVSKPPLPPGSGEEDEREQVIQLSEIQTGDRIIAQANENIKGKTEFEATKIRVLASEF